MSSSSTLVTPDQLKHIIPNNKEITEWCQALNSELPKWGIDTRDRVAAFIAQCAHESAQFTRLSENLNYSEQGLLSIFSRYFTPAQAKSYARQPERIANRAYANRIGNGNEASGDGWRFRGGGLMQLTGRANYAAFARAAGIEESQAPAYVRTKAGAIASAAWFWKTNDLNRFADAKNITKLTQKINGGTNGLQERIAYYDRAQSVLTG